MATKHLITSYRATLAVLIAAAIGSLPVVVFLSQVAK